MPPCCAAKGSVMGELFLRAYNLQRDLDGMVDLGEAAYVEDYARIGTSVRAGMERERHAVAILSLAAKLIPRLRDVSPGFVWVDGERIVSFVSFARRGLSGDAWSIETVMTHPNFQGRGLARKLVETSLDEIRRRGGRICTLKVRADNEAAYHLYRNIGFAHCDTTVHMRAERPHPVSCLDISGEARLRRIPHKEWHRTWEARHALAQRETPSTVRGLLPVSPSEYKRPWIARALGPILARVSGQRIERWASHQAGTLVATLGVRGDLGGEGTHEIDIHLDPKHAARLALPLVARGLLSLADLAPCPLLCETRATNEPLLAALRARGFSEMAVWHTLALRLDTR